MNAKIGAMIYIIAESVYSDVISNKIGLQCEIDTEGKRYWRIEADKKERLDVSQTLDELRDIMLLKHCNVIEVINRYQLVTKIVICIESETNNKPEICFTTGNIEFLSSINAEVSFDFNFIDVEQVAYARLSIFGNSKQDIISKQLGLQPITEMNTNDYLKENENYVWEVETEKEDCSNISEVVDKLYNLVSEKLDFIRKAMSEYQLKTKVTIYIKKDESYYGPETNLTYENIEFLADINANVSFEVSFIEDV